MNKSKQNDQLKNLPDVALDSETLQIYSSHGIVPTSVAMPNSVDEVPKWLETANSRNVKVQLWGKGTHQHIGGISEETDIALVLDHLNKITAFNPEDLNVTVQCGITLKELQRTLAKNNLYLPIDPPCSQNSSLGGIVSANVYGPRSHRFGTARDMVLGLGAVLADGKKIKSGGQTVKNVAGYDLCKLYIGSMGTLGAVTEITFKLWPLPESSQMLIAGLNNMENAAAVSKEILHSPMTISGLVYLNPNIQIDSSLNGSRHTLLVILDDREMFIKRTIAALDKIVECHSGTLHAVSVGIKPTTPPEMIEKFFIKALNNDNPGGFILRAILPKSKVFEFSDAVGKLCDQAQIIGYCGRGVVYVISSLESAAYSENIASLISRIRSIAKEFSGTLVIEKASTKVKRRVEVWDIDAKQLEWMRKIKHSFDPNGVFAAGRFVGGI